MSRLRNHVRTLYQRLEWISLVFNDVTDTDVRESIHTVLNFYFVWDGETAGWPKRYEMFTRPGDFLVATTVSRFLKRAVPQARADGVEVGAARLAVLQDDTIRTMRGESFDLFIGATDEPLPHAPLDERFFGPGDYGDGY